MDDSSAQSGDGRAEKNAAGMISPAALFVLSKSAVDYSGVLEVDFTFTFDLTLVCAVVVLDVLVAPPPAPALALAGMVPMSFVAGANRV